MRYLARFARFVLLASIACSGTRSASDHNDAGAGANAGGSTARGGAAGKAGTHSAGSGQAGALSGAGASGTGGTRSSNGASGSGGMHVASPCSALPAAGTWQHINPTGTMKETKSIALDPFDSAVVWAANENGLNESSDCGATWTLVSTGQNGDRLKDSSLWSIAVDPVDQGTIFLIGGYGALSLWRSKNGGVDWTDMFPPKSEYATHAESNFANNVSMDPTNHLHLVVTTHGSCSAPYDPNCDAETFDGGETWTLSKAPSGWAEGGGVFVLDEKTWLWCDPFGGIWRTGDGAKSFQKVRTGFGGNGEFTNGPYVAASDGAYYLTSVQGILRSADRGQTWTQIKMDGKWVGFAMSKTTLYAADQWGNTFASAKISDPMTWTTFPPPAGLRASQGAPFLAYDEDHHLLYASTWPDGLWRLVTE